MDYLRQHEHEDEGMDESCPMIMTVKCKISLMYAILLQKKN